MKRLMVMLSAVAVGFGLFAADDGFVAGTGFESDDVGPFAPESGWTIPTGDANQALTVTEYGTGEAYKGDVPAKYADEETNAQFLDVKTSFGSPITCDLPEAQDMGDIYFDSLVKFTACDEDPTDGSYAGAKLVVYTKEIEGTGDTVSTKLFVKGGLLASDGSVTPTAFDCGPWDSAWGAPDAWVRLTIKSIGNIAANGTVPAFAIFINGAAIATHDSIVAEGASFALNSIGKYWLEEKSDLFPSLISINDLTYGPQAGKVTQVGFDGQGKIDDLSFTTTVPSFCADPAFFTFTWDENVAGISYVLGDKELVELSPDQVAVGSIAIPYVAQDSCTITVTPKDGFVIDAWTGDPDVNGNAGTFALPLLAGGVTTKANTPKATITIDGVAVTDPICTVADAIDVINNASGAKVVMTLIDNMEAGLGDGVTEFTVNSGADVTIDLAGYTLTGTAEEAIEDSLVTAMSDLTIIDSVGGGKIVADPAIYTYGAVSTYGGDITIGAVEGDEGATIEGGASAGDGDTLSIVRGKFDGDTAPTAIADGSECSAEKVGGYWVVAPKAAEKHGWAIYLAEGENANEFLIQDEQDLIELATWANKTDEDGETFPTKDITFTQTADITLTAPFAGIGVPQSADDNFQGTYDGNGKSISNYVMKSRADGNNYRGLFNTTMGATIKDLTVNCAGFEDGISSEKGTAGIVGDAKTGTLVQGCTVAGTISGGTHNVAGIAIRVTDSTLLNCTNNANITGGYTKVAGIAALTKSSKSKALLEGCVNNGTITANGGGTAGRDGLAGIIAYTEDEKLYIKDCVNTGALVVGSTADPNPKVGQILGYSYKKTVFQGANKGTTDKLLVNGLSTNNGYNFATVEDDVATLIADTAVAADGSYLVAAPVSTKAVTLALGETIAFDNKLYNSFAANVTTSAGAGYKVNSDVQGTVTTYSVGAITYNITFTTQDGTTAPEAMTYTVNSTFPLALADATTELTGIEFKGWTNATYTTAIKAIPELPATLGDIALVAQWDAVVAPEDWDNPKVDPAIPGTKAADAWPSLAETPLAQADAAKLAAWAKAKDVTFDKAAEIKVEAFLLDCANTEQAVDDAKKAFKVTSITQDAEGNWVATVGDAGDGEEYKNGYINIVPYALEGAGDDAKFFQAQLLLQPAE